MTAVDKDERIRELEAEVAELKEQLHYANGTCDLAMKQRDEAEASLAANAEFIFDAFNVRHETGLSPRELADRLAKAEQQRDQAVAALKNTLSLLKVFTRETDDVAKAVWDEAETAIASTEGGAK